MHIVFVSREYHPTQRGGGIASYVETLSASLVSRGHSVTVICASDDTSTSSDCLENGIRVIRLSGGDFALPCEKGYFPLKKLRCLYRFYSYRRKVRETVLSLSSIDVIEVPDYGAEGYYLFRGLRIPVVVRLHGPSFYDCKTQKRKKIRITRFYEWWLAREEERYLKKARYLSSPSRDMAKWISENLLIGSRKIKFLKNMISVSEKLASSEVGLDIRKNSILFAGTVSDIKGISELIDACLILRQKNPSVRLDVFGRLGLWGQELKAKVEKAGYSWCCFKGKISRKTLLDEYSSHEICCFPSWWESFGLVCVEAMSCGSIVVGSSCGGMTEIITPGYDGFLVEPRSVEKLANTLDLVLSLTEEEKADIRKRSKNKAIKCFSTQALTPLFEEYYASLTEDYSS